ncbi:hypothetical protein Ahy_A06g025943 [Arachis hypogaea]|uniref:Ubiquitin-like protease family profile domain-containing protein n=1 Tax=Arachis hypogaea TaxID=3818 RepID=A0A445CJ26_ARAHY|nr:hypothetical protein Ahy_A06g025943 [Arachis hypogaea]
MVRQHESAPSRRSRATSSSLSASWEDVSKGLSTEELTETYVPFWVKPSRFIRRIFIPIEDIFMHWYYMVVDYDMNTVYHLDSYPDPKMLGKLHEMMTSSSYGPLRAFTPPDLGRWPIRRGNGVPNSLVLGLFLGSILQPLVHQWSVRGTTTVSLVGGPFNAIGGLVRMWAQKWQSCGRP